MDKVEWVIKANKKPTSTLISDHRLIGFNCKLQLGGTINPSGYLQAAATAKEPSGLLQERDFDPKLCQGPRFLQCSSYVDMGEVQTP